MQLPLVCCFCTVLLAVSALPAPSKRQPDKVLSLPFTKRMTRQGNTALRRRAFSASLTNVELNYEIDITIGTPPQQQTVVLDTGSSDIWFYAPECDCSSSYYDYDASSTETTLNGDGTFHIGYGSSPQGVTGFYASDLLSVNGHTVTQTIGVATAAGAGTPPGGIMGIGLPLDESIVRYGQGVAPFPGYLDSLKNAGIINTRAYSLYLEDQTPTDTTPGTIIFGGYNPVKYTGDLVSFAIVTPAPDGLYRLDVDEPAISMTLDGQTTILVPDSSEYTVVLDSGTSFILLPEIQFTELAVILSDSVDVVNVPLADGTSQLNIPCALSSSSGGLTFGFSGADGNLLITVPWSELVLPSSDSTDVCVLGVGWREADDAEGVYVLGDTFLRSAYLIYDFDALTISIAQASYDSSPGTIVGL